MSKKQNLVKHIKMPHSKMWSGVYQTGEAGHTEGGRRYNKVKETNFGLTQNKN